MQAKTRAESRGQSPRGRRTRWPASILAVLLCAYLLALVLVLDDDVWGTGLVNLLELLTRWVPALVCWLAVRRVGPGRVELVLASLAVTANAAADTYFFGSADANGIVQFPSPADAGYISFYVLMLAALAVLVRRQVRRSTRSVLLDCTVGSCGAATVLTLVLGPVIGSLTSGTPSASVTFATVYTVFDGLLLAAIAGLATATGLFLWRRWLLLVAGVAIFAASDLRFFVTDAAGLYLVGTPLDAGWAAGLALIALWVHVSARTNVVPHDRLTTESAFLVPAGGMAAGLAVLVVGTQTPVPWLAVLCAAMTLVVAALPLASRQRALRTLARTDELTGLPNRRAFYAEVPERLAAARGSGTALLLMDLDRFKEVNDSLGHDVGDRLLVRVGLRLAEHLGPRDLLARLGGDEFAILLESADTDEAVVMAIVLRAAIAETFTLEGIALNTNVSIGIAPFPGQADDLTGLLRKADMAMYKAKTSRTGYHLYASADETHFGNRLRTVHELRAALANDELVLHYQPKVDLLTDEVTGVEALVRWEHPTRGLLYPGAFLDLVEESGLMHHMTHLLLAKALDQAAVWMLRGLPLAVSVNLSPSSLVDRALPGRIAAMIERRGLPASALTLEITEEYLMNDYELARSSLNELRDRGILISIDDFGTGYSSLAYLRDLPIDEVKLDRSFLIPMQGDRRAAALVASTIDLAHSLSLRMVAEGVENGDALAELARYGCDEAQGFFISRPIPGRAFDAWLRERRAAAASTAAALPAGR